MSDTAQDGEYREVVEVVDAGPGALIVRRFEGTDWEPEYFRVFEDEMQDLIRDLESVVPRKRDTESSEEVTDD